ncbi:hypothetical protein KIPB_013509, partial [Kipferlia bialata]
GVGILTLPLAVAEAGIGLTTCVMCVIAFLSSMAMKYLTIAVARVGALRRYDMSVGYGGVTSKRSLLEDVDASTPEQGPVKGRTPDFDICDDEIHEVTAMMKIVCGSGPRNVYFGALLAYLFVTLWSYASVFSQSASSYIPLPGVTSAGQCVWADRGETGWSAQCETSYAVYTLLFGLVTVWMACKEMSETVVIQSSSRYVYNTLYFCM